MIRRFAILAALALAACTAEVPLSKEVVDSEMARNPEASYLDSLGGKLKWNYTTGLELKAFLDACIDDPAVVKYVDDWYDAIIGEDGSIGVNYKLSNYSSDHICPGRTLFQLYDITGKEKYRKAMDNLYLQIKQQPRTKEGGFWHKQIYPDQMWLDGLYMVEPFYAEYTERYVPDVDEEANYRDIIHQFLVIVEHTYDPDTRLYRHAWDSSRSIFWADPETGQSSLVWGRALGWYVMALVDVLPHIPVNINGRTSLISLLSSIVEALPEYADPVSGMWYQVLERPGAEGNYLEATCSAMFVYAMLKGCRYGYLDCLEYAKESYLKLLDTFVTYDEEGRLDLNNCCAVAGLGGKEMRSGSYDYYIHEKVRSNDAKGIGPLIWAALEYERL